MDRRRLPPFGIAEAVEQLLEAAEGEIDFFRMQRAEPFDQGVGGIVRALLPTHAGGTHPALSGAGNRAVVCAGARVSNAQSFESVARRSWRCTTMSTMP